MRTWLTALLVAGALALSGCILEGPPDEAAGGDGPGGESGPPMSDCAGPEVVPPDDPCFDDTNQTGDPYERGPDLPHGHVGSVNAPA